MLRSILSSKANVKQLLTANCRSFSNSKQSTINKSTTVENNGNKKLVANIGNDMETSTKFQNNSYLVNNKLFIQNNSKSSTRAFDLKLIRSFATNENDSKK